MTPKGAKAKSSAVSLAAGVFPVPAGSSPGEGASAAAPGSTAAASAAALFPFPPKNDVLVYAMAGKLVVVCNANNAYGSRWVGPDTALLMQRFGGIGCGARSRTDYSAYEHVSDQPYHIKEAVVGGGFGGYKHVDDVSVTCIRAWIDFYKSSDRPEAGTMPVSFLAAAVGGNQ